MFSLPSFRELQHEASHHFAIFVEQYMAMENKTGVLAQCDFTNFIVIEAIISPIINWIVGTGKSDSESSGALHGNHSHLFPSFLICRNFNLWADVGIVAILRIAILWKVSFECIFVSILSRNWLEQVDTWYFHKSVGLIGVVNRIQLNFDVLLLAV